MYGHNTTAHTNSNFVLTGGVGFLFGLQAYSARDHKIIQGAVVIDKSTKKLIKRIKPGEIAFIDHQDIDQVAAEGLIDKRVRAVLNSSQTLSGTYPTPGPEYLLRAGIPILDEVNRQWMEKWQDGEVVWIEGNRFGYVDHRGERVYVGTGKRLTRQRLATLMQTAHDNLETTLEQFIDNTLTYAAKEKSFVTKSLAIPPLRTKMKGKHVVVVVRGADYKADLHAIRSYIRDYQPVLIGVDGGADALLDNNLQPDLIIGDMDSVSDRALRSGAELVVHAYPNGEAPGLARLNKLGLEAHLIPAIGTSEDVAMLMAFEKKAKLIVALGTHSHMVDFLEKGRKGMASTLLVRMKIGTRLVDAKGVNYLYQGRYRRRELTFLAISSAFPIVALFGINPDFRHMVRLLWLHVRMMLT